MIYDNYNQVKICITISKTHYRVFNLIILHCNCLPVESQVQYHFVVWSSEISAMCCCFFLFYFELAFWNRLWFLFVWSQQEKLLTVSLVGTLSVLFLLLDFTVRYLKHCQTWRVLTTKFRLSVGSPTGERHWPQVAAVIVETWGILWLGLLFFYFEFEKVKRRLKNKEARTADVFMALGGRWGHLFIAPVIEFSSGRPTNTFFLPSPESLRKKKSTSSMQRQHIFLMTLSLRKLFMLLHFCWFVCFLLCCPICPTWLIIQQKVALQSSNMKL